MRAFILMASVAALTIPLVSLAPAAQAQSGWSRHDRTSAGYTLRQVSMWAGPDTDYPGIRSIPGNRRVDIYGCLNNWSWCDVGYRSDRGWVAGRFLGADYRGRRQSFVTVAPYMSILVLSFRFDDYWDNHYRSRPFYSDRSRWESHYYDNYRPEWGPRPTTPDRYRRGSDWQRPQMAPDRRGSGYRDQPVNPYRRDATPQAVPTPDHPSVSPGAMRHRDQRPWEATPPAQGRNDSAAGKQDDAQEHARRKAEGDNMHNDRQ